LALNLPGRREVIESTKTRLINLQPGKNGKAKPYQVKQVLKIIEERYGC